MNDTINLPKTIKALEELILASSGADPFDEILKIIFIKLYSEKNKQNNISNDQQFKNAKKEWPGIFTKKDKVNISPEILKLCLNQLENINLYKTNLQILDATFEYLLPKKAKGNRGQYFTPRHIIDEIIKIINPKKGELILDPACGSGGFLLHSANYINSDINLYGVDFDNQIQKIARILFLLSGYEKVKIINDDTLTISTKNGLNNNSFDIIMTNPPFGGQIKDKNILHKFELAKDINKRTRNIVARHILFIERIINLLKPGGRSAIIVPQGILNNTNLEYLRTWIYSKARILGVIGMDTNSFKPHTNVKTSILFLQKWQKKPLPDYPIFTAVSQKSGKNLSGNLIYKTQNKKQIIDTDLPEITKEFQKFIKKEILNF